MSRKLRWTLFVTAVAGAGVVGALIQLSRAKLETTAHGARPGC